MSLDGAARSASVVTTEPTTCAIVNRAQFREFLLAIPISRCTSIDKLIHRVRVATENVKSLALSDVYGRLVRLLNTGARTTRKAAVVHERLTQQEIADRVGASRDMIGKLMKDLVAGGYLHVEDRTITILGSCRSAGSRPPRARLCSRQARPTLSCLAPPDGPPRRSRRVENRPGPGPARRRVPDKRCRLVDPDRADFLNKSTRRKGRDAGIASGIKAAAVVTILGDERETSPTQLSASPVPDPGLAAAVGRSRGACSMPCARLASRHAARGAACTSRPPSASMKHERRAGLWPVRLRPKPPPRCAT